MEDLKKVFNVMHVLDAERVELATYQLKNMSRTWFDHWNENIDEDAPHPCWDWFEDALLVCFFLRELKEEKVWEFPSLK